MNGTDSNSFSIRTGIWLRVAVVEDRLEDVIKHSVRYLNCLCRMLSCLSLELRVYWVHMLGVDPKNNLQVSLVDRISELVAKQIHDQLRDDIVRNVKVQPISGLTGDRWTSQEHHTPAAIVKDLSEYKPDLIIVDERMEVYGKEDEAPISPTVKAPTEANHEYQFQRSPADLLSILQDLDSDLVDTLTDALFATSEEATKKQAVSSGGRHPWDWMLWDSLVAELAAQSDRARKQSAIAGRSQWSLSSPADGYAPYVVQLSIDPQRQNSIRPNLFTGFVAKPSPTIGINSSDSQELDTYYGHSDTSSLPNPYLARHYAAITGHLAGRWTNGGAVLVGPFQHGVAQELSPFRIDLGSWTPGESGLQRPGDPIHISWVLDLPDGSDQPNLGRDKAHRLVSRLMGSRDSEGTLTDSSRSAYQTSIEALRNAIAQQAMVHGRVPNLPWPLALLIVKLSGRLSPPTQALMLRELVEQGNRRAMQDVGHPALIYSMHVLEPPELVKAYSEFARQNLPEIQLEEALQPFPDAGNDQPATNSASRLQWDDLVRATLPWLCRLRLTSFSDFLEDLPEPALTELPEHSSTGIPIRVIILRWGLPSPKRIEARLVEHGIDLRIEIPEQAIPIQAAYRFLVSLARTCWVCVPPGHFSIPWRPLAKVVRTGDPVEQKRILKSDDLHRALEGVMELSFGSQSPRIWDAVVKADAVDPYSIWLIERYTPENLWALLEEVVDDLLPRRRWQLFSQRIQLGNELKPLDEEQAFMFASAVVFCQENTEPIDSDGADFIDALIVHTDDYSRWTALAFWLVCIFGDIADGKLKAPGTIFNTATTSAFEESLRRSSGLLARQIFEHELKLDPNTDLRETMIPLFEFSDTWSHRHFREGSHLPPGHLWRRLTPKRKKALGY